MDKYAGHTPGPLTIKGPSSGGTPCDDGGDYAIYDTDGYIIGEAIRKVGRDRHGCSIIVRNAKQNAELWAAAPALAAENKRLRAALEQVMSDDLEFMLAGNGSSITVGAQQMARAALAQGDNDNG